MEYTITGKTPVKLEEKLALYKKLTALRDDLSERLGKANAAKGSVSSKIFEKVKTEYSSKLENVHAQLSPIQSELEREKKGCEELLPRLEEEIRVMEDELAEAEFRFRVGEFDQNKLTEIQTRLNPDLADKSEHETEVSARLKTIDTVFNVTAPEHDTAESTESVAPEEKEERHDNQDEEENETDDASSSRVTLSSDDPLEALTDKPANTADGGESKNKPAPASSPAEESKEEVQDAYFENPQEWIDELGEDAGNFGGKSATKTAENKPKTGSTNQKDKDDPLSALADPSGDPGDATETAADVDAEPEEVSAGFPNMVIITGPGSGKKIPLLPMTMSIGREHDNNIELKDPDVGRYHARILFDRGRFVLEDLESSNGTWLNGEKITEAALKNGDRIKIGETALAIDFD